MYLWSKPAAEPHLRPERLQRPSEAIVACAIHVTFHMVTPQELEEDPELRAKIALYRDPAVDPAAVAARRAAAMAQTDDDDEVPEVRGPGKHVCVSCTCPGMMAMRMSRPCQRLYR